MNNRSLKWDNIKFILIFLVVLGHITDIYAEVSPLSAYIRLFIYSFHMPLFMFISGLFGKKNIKEKRYGKISYYLVLYVFIKLLIFISKWIANGTKPGFSLFSEGGAPWYVFCLFVFSFVTMITDRMKPKYVLVFSLVLALAAGYDNNLKDFLCIQRLFVFYPYYYIGFILEPDTVSEFCSKKKMYKYISAGILVAFMVIAVIFYDSVSDIKYLFTGRNPYCTVYPNCPYAFLLRLFCYIVSSLMGLSVIALVPENMCGGFFAKIGARSVQIYALHFPLKVLYFGLINDQFHIEGLFVSRLIIYELIVLVVLTAVCALPFWEKVFEKLNPSEYLKN